jgi:hypothetical protein
MLLSFMTEFHDEASVSMRNLRQPNEDFEVSYYFSPSARSRLKAALIKAICVKP